MVASTRQRNAGRLNSFIGKVVETRAIQQKPAPTLSHGVKLKEKEGDNVTTHHNLSRDAVAGAAAAEAVSRCAISSAQTKRTQLGFQSRSLLYGWRTVAVDRQTTVDGGAMEGIRGRAGAA